MDAATSRRSARSAVAVLSHHTGLALPFVVFSRSSGIRESTPLTPELPGRRMGNGQVASVRPTLCFPGEEEFTPGCRKQAWDHRNAQYTTAARGWGIRIRQ